MQTEWYLLWFVMYKNKLWGRLISACLSHCLAVCLQTWVVPSTSGPFDSRSMSYFQSCLASLPSFHFFHSSPKPVSLLGSPYLGQDVPWMESSPDSGQTPQPPSIFCPHPLEHLFQMWLFLTPCAISLPDLPPISESVWLARQFHRISHAKRDPREGEPLLLIPFVAPLRRLSKLC